MWPSHHARYLFQKTLIHQKRLINQKNKRDILLCKESYFKEPSCAILIFMRDTYRAIGHSLFWTKYRAWCLGHTHPTLRTQHPFGIFPRALFKTNTSVSTSIRPFWFMSLFWNMSRACGLGHSQEMLEMRDDQWQSFIIGHYLATVKKWNLLKILE